MTPIAQQLEETKAKDKSYLVNTENILYPVRLSVEQCSSEESTKYKAEATQGSDLLTLQAVLE